MLWGEEAELSDYQRMSVLFFHLQRNFYTFFERNLFGKLLHCINRKVYFDFKCGTHKIQLNDRHKLEFDNTNCISCLRFQMMNASTTESMQGEKRNETRCVNNFKQTMSSDVESFDLDRLFDMEEVVKNVKIKLKEKRGSRPIVEEVRNKRRKNKKKEKTGNECLIKDDLSSDSSFGLASLFAPTKTHPRKKTQRSKKGNKNVERIKDHDSYGLKWLFSEKNINVKKRIQKSRKRKQIDYDNSEQDDNETDEGIKVKKKRPNHFVAIRISDSGIHHGIKSFQDAVIKENENLKQALIPLVSLHITLAVMYLDETMLNSALNALQKCKDKIFEALNAIKCKLVFCGVGNFRNEIVFANLQEKEHIKCLKAINSIITATFEDDGICISNKKEFNPHLTLLKLSRKKLLRKNGIKKVGESVYDSWHDFYFGEEVVHNILLCSMQGTKEQDGFYQCLSTINFCNDSDNSNASVENT